MYSVGQSNPLDRKHIARLRASKECANRKLRPFREKRMETLRQMVGAHHGENGAIDKVPINLIELSMNIYMNHLVSSDPESLVSTWVHDLKAQAEDLEIATNHVVKKMELGETMRMVVFDAMIAWGATKTGVTEDGAMARMASNYASGMAYCDHILCEDWFHDTSARRFAECSFMGNRYKLPYDVVMARRDFKKSVRDQIKPSESADNEWDSGSEERSEDLTNGNSSGFEDEYEDQVEFEDYWMPRQGLLITLPCDQSIEEPIKVMEWTGPEWGPYDVLNFTPIPGNVIGLAPASLWRDLHTIVNVLWNKLMRQASRAKTVLGARGPAEDDAKRIMEAEDGEVIKIDDPGGAREYNLNNIDPRVMGFAVQCRDLFSWTAGNLDTLGGLSAQSGTVGQERFLVDASSKRVQMMQNTTMRFTRRRVKDVAYYLWTDPLISLPLIKRRPGIEIPFRFEAGDLSGAFIDYNFDIAVGSMTYRAPGEQLQMLTSVVQTMLMPILPLLQQQGIELDARGLMKKVAKLGRLPELEDILIFVNGDPQGRKAMNDDASRKAPVSTRNYVRHGRSAQTRQGADAMEVQKLMSMARPSVMGGGA